jgi:hypothetical protein
VVPSTPAEKVVPASDDASDAVTSWQGSREVATAVAEEAGVAVAVAAGVAVGMGVLVVLELDGGWVADVEVEPHAASASAQPPMRGTTTFDRFMALYSGSGSGEDLCMGAGPSSALAASLRKAIRGRAAENVICRPVRRWTAVPLTPSERSPSPGLQTRTMKVSTAREASRGVSGCLKGS